MDRAGCILLWLTIARPEAMEFRKTPEDDTLWRMITADVTPLGPKKRRPKKVVLSKTSKIKTSEINTGKIKSSEIKEKGPGKTPGRAPKRVMPNHPDRPPPVTVRSKAHPELSHGAAPGVDRRTAMRLHRGQMEIQARLDLHGRTQDDAFRALCSFIDGAHGAGRRSVLIITGKGQGILKNAVPRWLNQPPLRARILSFSYAQQKDGGAGALYVLLRRDRGCSQTQRRVNS
ncbi:MAG: DNA-nicking Smr family endonuclease [Alphaproteobacteria bacterium]|jgi:DNA-nicking Smr family endonuclease